MIAVTYPWRDVEVYSHDGQSTLGEFTCGNSSVMTADNNSLYFIDQNNKEIILINVENNEEQTIIPLAIDLTRNADISYDDGTIYICDVSGIHLKKDGGSIFETILDGNQGSLGMPSYELHDFIPGPQNDYYYVLWKNMDASDVVIKHVYFDENASILPEEELSIFSVEDNRTIRQAISTFRQSHPDININYRVANPNRKRIYTYGLKDPEATVTLQDQINALNTELLSDRGADILIMDELPMDSYIEKGVLEDMSDIFKPMIKNGELLENIAEDFMVNDKIYTMPVRIKLPLIYGNSEAVKAAESMEKLAAYAKDSTDIPLLRESNHRAMTAWFLLLYYNQILNEENEIDEELLIRFLEDVNIVAANIGASDDAPIDWMNSIKGTEMGYWIAGVVNVHKKLTQVNIEELTGFMEFATPIAAAGKWQGTFDVVNNTYRANTLVGLNSAGNNKELAKEFIQHLFSMDIQGAELYDGFPVNTSVLELLILKNNEMGTYSVGDGSYSISAAYPSLENRKLIYEYIKALERPMENDSIMIDMILDEAERYLRGDISVNQAVDNILAGINTYLSE
jgi:ABC-type glycerol-3-phosphate transport system substrate-binding protein